MRFVPRAALRGGDRPSVAALLLLWGLVALVIGARRPSPPSLVVEPASSVERLQVDLNRDPWPRLTLLEGIGETLARRIVEVRESLGGFRRIEEVLEVRGVPDLPVRRALESGLIVPLDEGARERETPP